MRLRALVTVVASLDDNEKQVQFERQDATLNGAISTHGAENSGQIVMAAAEAGYLLPLGKVVTGQYLYVETDRELGIKLDGSADEVILKPPASGVSARFSAHLEFTTAPELENKDGSNTATVSFLIAGATS
jgi:hypothetical protein